MCFVYVLCYGIRLHRGSHDFPVLQQGYGHCCRMSNPNDNPDAAQNVAESRGDAPGGDPPGVRTRSRSAAAGAMAQAATGAGGPTPTVQPVVDVQSLVTAMSHLNAGAATSLEKGMQPKWDLKTERFYDFKRKVDIWAASHDIAHLFERPPYPSDSIKHDAARRIILLSLPNHDQQYVLGTSYLSEAWEMLLVKYMPSIDAEKRDLFQRFDKLSQHGKTMEQHVNDCMTVRNQLMALGESISDGHFRTRLLEVDRECAHLRAALADKPVPEIIAGLTDHYRYIQSINQQQKRQFYGRGHRQRHGSRGPGAPPAPGAAVMAAVSGAGGGDRACYECGKTGHIREDCPELHAEVRSYLKKQML